MIRDALVLAAGRGSRLRSSEDDLPKPLHEVGGQTLIKRTLLSLAGGGVRRAFVVIGFLGDQVRAAVEGDLELARHGLRVEFVENGEYDLSNGVSVLSAADRLSEHFLISMADHVYDASLAHRAVRAQMRDADLYLCVDRRLGEIYDMDDATKVRTEGDRIVEIGKTLDNFDCIDCGVFAVSRQLLACLAQVRAERGDCSLSDGVRRLSAGGRARVLDIGAAFWQDVNTEGALARAEVQVQARPIELPAAMLERPSVRL